MSYIAQEKLLCQEAEPTKAVYRASIFEYGNYSASQMVGYIEEWVRSGGTILRGVFLPVTFDPTCPVRISDFDEPICIKESTAVNVISPTSTSAPQSLNTFTLGAVVASVSVAVIAAAVITIVSISIVYVRRKKKKLAYINYCVLSQHDNHFLI